MGLLGGCHGCPEQPPWPMMYVLSWKKVQDCFWLAQGNWIILTIELGFVALVLGLFWEKLPSSIIDWYLWIIFHVQCCAKGPIRWLPAYILILKVPICVANLCVCPSQVLPLLQSLGVTSQKILSQAHLRDSFINSSHPALILSYTLYEFFRLIFWSCTKYREVSDIEDKKKDVPMQALWENTICI